MSKSNKNKQTDTTKKTGINIVDNDETKLPVVEDKVIVDKPKTNDSSKDNDSSTDTKDSKPVTGTEDDVKDNTEDTSEEESAPAHLEAVKAVLDSYSTAMSSNLTENQYVAQQGNMYQQLKNILLIVDFNEFKDKWDLVNTYFKDDAEFQPMRIYRYDYVNGSAHTDKSIMSLLAILTELNDPETRVEKLKGFDSNKALKEITIGETAVSNLLKYYTN